MYFDKTLLYNYYNKNTKKIIIFATGGLVNALNNVIGGMFLASKLHLEPQLYWIKGYIALDIDINDIFDINTKQIKLLTETEYGAIMKHDSLKLAHMYLPEFGQYTAFTNISKLSLEQIAQIVNSTIHTNIFYNNCEEYDWMTSYDPFFNVFKFKEFIWKNVNTFIHENNNIDTGIHIRGTDISCVLQDVINTVYMCLEKNKNQNIFICSDDKKIEDALITKYPNCKRYNDKIYVEKYNENLTWNIEATNNHLNCTYFNHDNKTFKMYSSYNVYRSKEHIIGAVQDLLTLAKMTHIYAYKTSINSTYFKLALKLREYLIGVK